MNRVGSSILVLALVVACALSDDPEPRIIGGEDARTNEFPYQVAIVRSGGTTFRCSGVIVKENFVLTTAYCGNLHSASEIEVIAGNVRLSRASPSQIVGVDYIRTHGDYNVNGRIHDVAVLKLKKSLKTDSSVKTIPLWSTKIPALSNCIFSGWGSKSKYGPVSDTLQKLSLQVQANETCRALLPTQTTFGQGQFCAGGLEINKNACDYDEGGPLVFQGRLAGLLSHAPYCGDILKPGVYTDVSVYKRWIDNTLNAAPLNSLSAVTLAAMLTTLITVWNSRI